MGTPGSTRLLPTATDFLFSRVDPVTADGIHLLNLSHPDYSTLILCNLLLQLNIDICLLINTKYTISM